MRLWELLCDLGDGRSLVEADGDHEVGLPPRRRREVRDVRLRRGRLVDHAADPELLLRTQQALVGELVEAVVVQLVDVRDEHDERLAAVARARRRAPAARAAAAARREGGGERENGSEPQQVHRNKCRSLGDLSAACKRMPRMEAIRR